jgi:hypothetical protein
MSAAPSMALEKAQRRVATRKPIHVPLDLIALRSGVPENLPGRCTDLSEAGLGAIVAGELSAGQQVALELRLPNVAVPFRARAVVRYESRLRCGLEFVGLSVEQQEMIRYWSYTAASEPIDSAPKKLPSAITKLPAAEVQPVPKRRRRFRVGRRKIYALMIGLLLLASLAWWQWQRSWNELEKRTPVVNSRLRVLPKPSSDAAPKTLSESNTESIQMFPLVGTAHPAGLLRR